MVFVFEFVKIDGNGFCLRWISDTPEPRFSKPRFRKYLDLVNKRGLTGSFTKSTFVCIRDPSETKSITINFEKLKY